MASRLLAESPVLARLAIKVGATRKVAETYFFKEISHYAYAVWFIGGAALTLGMTVTRNVFSHAAIALPTWWLGGVLFVVLELIVHSISAVRGMPNFFNSRG